MSESGRLDIAKRHGPKMAPRRALEYLARLEPELRETPPAPGIEEVRRLMAAIPGSLTADFAVEREGH